MFQIRVIKYGKRITCLIINHHTHPIPEQYTGCQRKSQITRGKKEQKEKNEKPKRKLGIYSSILTNGHSFHSLHSRTYPLTIGP